MPISDERREVAELMRDEAAGFRRLEEEHGVAWTWTVDLGDVPAIFQHITHYIGLDGVVRAGALFDRLADLIDPTCHVDVDKKSVIVSEANDLDGSMLKLVKKFIVEGGF